ncbi:non-oxidative hydroxyarylic acid decarboxylases subunit D [Pelotomaculum propionicicum]|uniref:Phenolic acid decarboxylase subunit D n=1 Tax=Pelotomaculum propionicicum TaxID=258475 RepID=A0A4Y7RQ77_9FIRM|nr:non-oxidative hydroxyarylic acid decarboxylases subunit D [Pelotomaculum propionicicum]NLI14314.1 vanillic acid non-oxidative decarboxylation protein [Peptococcaceae bacterium]TEB10890.1 Phenolic acid decarboxylase subunit D [Pelotomaculum propionicicum]
MKCVRCLHDTAAKFAEAPDKSGAWEMYACSRCNFTWRNTEEPEVITPELRDKNFQFTQEVSDLQILVPVPPLKK